MIEAVFPTLVYVDNLGSIINNSYLYQKAMELRQTTNVANTWDSGMFNSLEAVDITSDREVSRLIDVCSFHILKFAREYGVWNKKVVCTDCWFNVYKQNDYQEIHTHPMQHFSLVYYVRVPPDSGSLVLTAPDDMFPLPPPDSDAAPRVCEHTFRINPNDSDVVIFRANTPHRVIRNKTDQTRVSIAMNFRMEEP
jgi:uncharacterized protein (TIGR02466 family)